MDALLRADKDGNDVITLSLGGPDGWTEGVTGVVASRLAAKGKILTIAAGNDGSLGGWFSSGPGNGLNVISVASVDNTAVNVQLLEVHGVEHEPIPYYAALPLHVEGTLPIYAISNDTTVEADGCDPLPDSTPDLSDKVVLIRRGVCTFVRVKLCIVEWA